MTTGTDEQGLDETVPPEEAAVSSSRSQPSTLPWDQGRMFRMPTENPSPTWPNAESVQYFTIPFTLDITPIK